MRAVLDRTPSCRRGRASILSLTYIRREQPLATAWCHAVGTACVPCGAGIERVEIEQVGERDRSVTADPDGQRERVLVGEDWQRDEFLLCTRTHSFSRAAARAWWVMGQAAPRLGRRWWSR